MEIQPVDVDDASTFDRFIELSRAAVLDGNSHDPPHTHLEMLAMLRNLDPAEHYTGYVGRLDGEVVCAGLVVLPMLDNLDIGCIQVWVEPALRRRGYGSAITDGLVSRVVAQGRTTLLSDVDYPFGADETHPYRAFAVSAGFTLANAEVHRILTLPVETGLLESLLREAAPHHRDYTFAEYTGALPDDLMAAYCELVNAITTDAPSGEIDLEEGRTTPADFAKRLESLAEQGRTLYSSVAFDSDGVPAAHSELIVPADDPGNIFQWATLVRRSHRGHRLGLATKVRNLRRVQALHPDRTTVHTWNAESNSYMIAVNERLGFVPIGYQSNYQRKV